MFNFFKHAQLIINIMNHLQEPCPSFCCTPGPFLRIAIATVVCFAFFVHHVLSSTSLSGTGRETARRNATGLRGIAAECRASLLVMICNKEAFWMRRACRSPWRKVQKGNVIEKKKRKIKWQMGERGNTSKSGIASPNTNTLQR